MGTPLPAAANVIKVTLTGTFGPAKWANIMHVHWTTGTPTAADLNTLAGQIGVQYGSQILANTNTLTKVTLITLQDVGTVDSSGNLIGLSGTDPTTHSGAVGGTPLSANVAIVIGWRIARHYRGGHPRSYVPGMTTANQTDSQHWTQTTADNMGLGANNFRIAVNALTSASTGLLTLGSVSYFKGHDSSGHPILRPVPVFDAFVGAHCDTRIDSQRRRLGKPTG